MALRDLTRKNPWSLQPSSMESPERAQQSKGCELLSEVTLHKLETHDWPKTLGDKQQVARAARLRRLIQRLNARPLRAQSSLLAGHLARRFGHQGC